MGYRAELCKKLPVRFVHTAVKFTFAVSVHHSENPQRVAESEVSVFACNKIPNLPDPPMRTAASSAWSMEDRAYESEPAATPLGATVFVTACTNGE